MFTRVKNISNLSSLVIKPAKTILDDIELSHCCQCKSIVYWKTKSCNGGFCNTCYGKKINMGMSHKKIQNEGKNFIMQLFEDAINKFN